MAREGFWHGRLPNQVRSGRPAKTKTEVIWHSCLTYQDDLAYCFSANLGVEPGFQYYGDDEDQILIGASSR
jgi:hypothetical protein